MVSVFSGPPGRVVCVKGTQNRSFVLGNNKLSTTGLYAAETKLDCLFFLLLEGFILFWGFISDVQYLIFTKYLYCQTFCQLMISCRFK